MIFGSYFLRFHEIHYDVYPVLGQYWKGSRMQYWSDWERLGAISGSIIIAYPSCDHDLVVHQAMIAIDFAM